MDSYKTDDDNKIPCYNCGNDMNYPHYFVCEEKYCYWCWNCAETQYIDLSGNIIPGHNPKCKKN